MWNKKEEELIPFIVRRRVLPQVILEKILPSKILI